MRWMLSLLLSATLAFSAGAQMPRGFFIMEDTARKTLATAWSPNEGYQPERGFCASYTVRRIDGEDVIVIVGVRPAYMRSASPYSSNFTCGNLPATAPLHTHPPATCRMDITNRFVCVVGGPDAYQCVPSVGDQDALDRSGMLIGFVQCDQHAIIMFTRKSVLPEP